MIFTIYMIPYMGGFGKLSLQLKKATEENRDAIIAERESKVYSNKLTEWQKEDGWKVNESVVEKIEFHNLLTQKDPASQNTEKETEKGTGSTEKVESTENK